MPFPPAATIPPHHAESAYVVAFRVRVGKANKGLDFILHPERIDSVHFDGANSMFQLKYEPIDVDASAKLHIERVAYIAKDLCI